MTDQPFPDRVTQLRRRWEADRTSRLFLQLAEEYRQLGRLRESVEVLDAGLVEHPGYLSALVAKGRCHLELDEPQAAREALERVVRQDATQAVASKLLVRAYIDLGELARARERLSLYALLHETDPDIAELRRRLEAPDPAPSAAAAAVSGTHDPLRAEPIGSKDATPARSDAMNEDIFDLRVPPRSTAPIPPSDDLFGLYQQPAPPPAAPAAERDRDGGAIFSGLDGGESRRRWAEGLLGGGIFDLRVLDLAPAAASPAPGLPAEPPRAEPAPIFAFEPAPPRAAPSPAPIFTFDPEPPRAPKLGFEPPPAEAAFAPEPALPPRAAVEAVEAIEMPAAVEIEAEIETEIEPEIEAGLAIEVEAEAETETVTLAELYLRQGHRDEALRILGQVLRREPENLAAHDLAARIRGEGARSTAAAEPPPDDSAFATRLAPLPVPPVAASPAAAAPPEIPAPLSPVAVDPVPPPSKTKRKVQLLSAYLERLRRGSAPGVS